MKVLYFYEVPNDSYITVVDETEIAGVDPAVAGIGPYVDYENALFISNSLLENPAQLGEIISRHIKHLGSVLVRVSPDNQGVTR